MTDARADRQEAREDNGRKKRVPMGSPQLKLSAPHRNGYVRRFINDHRGRIELAKNAGYTQVTNDKEAVKRQVGTAEDGSPLYAYLMEIKKEFYDEDQALKAAENNKVDESILRSQPTGSDEPGKFYAPAGQESSIESG